MKGRGCIVSIYLQFSLSNIVIVNYISILWVHCIRYSMVGDIQGNMVYNSIIALWLGEWE